MPQNTNFNVSPYFSDYTSENNEYQVLFKPDKPIQAREINNLQLILQDQIEKFGRHVFKEGSQVIPGQLRYEGAIDLVKIENIYNRLPISLYFDQLLGKKIVGQESGVKAEIVYTLSASESEINVDTLYVKYTQSGGENFENKKFFNNETLILDNESVSFSGYTISIGQGIANTVIDDSLGEGSLMSVSAGVYFVRGYFVEVTDQSLLLEPYNITPSYRIGFDVKELIKTAYDDSSLFDNAQGYPNYAAPGADRFVINLNISKKEINTTNSDNFVEIFRVVDGIPQYSEETPQYNIIRDELARRTYDESGDYLVRPFTLNVRETLNDRVRSDGIFYESQKTTNGNIPSENLITYQIGPGKAYVRGYDVETISNTLIDVEKPRTTQESIERVIEYNAGSLVIVNNSYGSPQLGLGTDSVVELRNERLGTDLHVATGTTIGEARFYDFVPETGFLDNTSRLFLRLFDYDLYSNIGLTTSISLLESSFIKGRRSGAEGYVKYPVSNSDQLTLHSVNGNFLENEQILINGIENGRLIKSVANYNPTDIKSLYSNIGINTFSGDIELTQKDSIAEAGTLFNISAESNGISTVTSGLERNFATKIKIGDLIEYNNLNSGNNIKVYNKVSNVSIGGTFFEIEPITSVDNIASGILPASDTQITGIKKIYSYIKKESSLLTQIGRNVSSIKLNDSEIIQRRSFNNVVFSNNILTINIPTEDTDIFFASFDEDRYIISYEDGSYEPLRREMQAIDLTGKTITFSGLTKASGTANVITTVRNIDPSFKVKKLVKNNTLILTGSELTSSGIGTTSLNDGLNYTSVYGTRVQDIDISLNVPDVLRVLAIYESYDANEPQIPKIQLDSFTGPTNTNADYILGEQIVGQTSGAVGLVVSRVETDKLEFVYLNTDSFSVNEIVQGKDSSVKSVITSKFVDSKNITKNFTFDSGQKESFYDYSRIIRKERSEKPKKQLKIIFQNFIIDSNDTGEFVSANSYSNVNFTYDIPKIGYNRLTDYIDIRPRVKPYISNSKSPFEFGSRDFSGDGQYSDYILAPDESIIIKYNYYVGRIDRIYLDPDGTFKVVKGKTGITPLASEVNDSSLLIATISLPPYMFTALAANVDMEITKRYRMADIALLENRIKRVEDFTTLNALETSVVNLKIKDAETGLDRFKSGFFVDSFESHEFHDLQNPSWKASIDRKNKVLRPKHYSTLIDLQLGSEVISGFTTSFISTKDHDYVDDLGSLGIRKTGDLITLNYSEILYKEQPYATRTESITPYLVSYWMGNIVLHPPEDHWMEERLLTTNTLNEITNTIQLDDELITTSQNVSENNEVFTDAPNANVGADPTFWPNRIRSYLSSSTLFRSMNARATNATKTNGFNKHSNSYYNFDRLDDQGGDYALGLFVNSGNKVILRSSGKEQTNTRSKYDNYFSTLREFLPENIINHFKSQVDSAGTKIVDYVIDFDQFNNDITTNTSTTTQTIVDDTTITIPPEITISETDEESISEYTENIEILRSRNIEFDVKGLKPVTRFYSFFENINIDEYTAPKLLEIEMISGSFEIGEVVESSPLFTGGKFIFRTCSPNHRIGPHNSPTDTYKIIPYTQESPPSDYSESSTFINVDTRALQLPSEVDFYGLPKSGMTLIGRTTGAIARVTTIRLVSDTAGRLIGSFFVPDPTAVSNPRWINGLNTFTVLDINDIALLADNPKISESSAEEDFISSAIRKITERNILTTRTIRIVPERQRIVRNITNISTTNTEITSGNNTLLGISYATFDPLAQSFYIEDQNGVFLTSIDVYFETKDDELPVTLQIRPMIAGVPSSMVVPFAEVTLEPDQVELSTDSSVPTRFTFPSPVYLNGPQTLNIRSAPIGSEQSSQYSVVLFSNSPQYRVYIAEMSENDILTDTLISQQPTLGSLFKSQNGVTWNPTQTQDLKYKLNRAEFNTDGLVRFFNPRLSLKNKEVTVTGQNQFVTLSKKVIVGLGSTGYDSNVVPGVTIIQENASGTLTGIAGSVTDTVITNVGAGYTDGTFTGEFVTESGFGQGAKGSFVFTGGELTGATITEGGFGYVSGDSLLIPQVFDSGINVGFGAKVNVNTVTNNNAFVIDNVQGSFSEVSGVTLSYINSSGITTYVGAGVTINAVSNDQYYDGRHLKIYHMNHCMHSGRDYIKVSKIRPIDSEVNTTLSQALALTDTSISIASTVGFDLFENSPVTTSNPGYILIGEELIGYTSVTSTSLELTDISQRGLENTIKLPYDASTIVRKYEFNGISLRRINKTHNMAEVNTNTHPITFNSYHIKIDTAENDFLGSGIGSDRSDLYFTDTTQIGRSGALLTNNIQFEEIKPNIANILPANTDMSSRIRTFSGSSLSGTEEAFVDEGFADISFTEPTYFAKPKLLCSDVNEDRFIDESPGNRSLTMEFLMNTLDTRVSPVIDLVNTSIILTTNLVNAPSGIMDNSSYSSDDFVRSSSNDKHSAIYISNPIFIKIPANSITVLLTASRTTVNDIRVLYTLYKVGQNNTINNYYELFPGYSNYQIDGAGIKRVIDISQNDGSSDSKIVQSSNREFKNYQYTVDNLDDFYGFAIKIVMASENQAIPPIIKDLRAIATVRPEV